MNGSQTILLCNSGSSSLKLALYHWDCQKDQSRCLAVEQVSAAPSGQPAIVADLLAQWPVPSVILHRVVHLGRVAEGPLPFDQALCQRLRHWAPLAPDHNPAALALFAKLQRQFPQARQFAIADSGLYHTLPAEARCYPLPDTLSPAWPIQRYGFHGLAHRAMWRGLRAYAGEAVEQWRVITLQLGSGCSATAWRAGQVRDTSMGFTPLEGLPMASRSGSIDPGILLHLLQREHWTADRLSELLQHQSGLRGASTAADQSGSADCRDLLARNSERDRQALSLFCYQVRKQIGAYWAALGGLDAVILGGGIAEHQPGLRAQILTGLEDLGLVLDLDANRRASPAQAGYQPLQRADSRVQAGLCPVNEMDEMLRQYQQVQGNQFSRKRSESRHE